MTNRNWRARLDTEWERRAGREGLLLPVLSDSYDRARLEEQSRAYVAALMAFLGDAIRGRTVLEVGGGTGRVTEPVARQARRVICVDLSAAMLERNRRHLGPAAARVAYVPGIAQDVCRGLRADVVLSSLVLIHQVEDEAFRELVAVFCGCAETIVVAENVERDRPDSPHTRLRSEAELCRAFREHGFVMARRRDDVWVFKDRHVLLKLVRGPRADAGAIGRCPPEWMR